MSTQEQLSEIKQFNQIPTWPRSSQIVMSGLEFEQIYNFIQMFSGPVMAMQSVFDRHLNNGTIKIKYEYADGSGTVPEAEVEKYTQLLSDLLKEKMQTESDTPKIITEI